MKHKSYVFLFFFFKIEFKKEPQNLFQLTFAVIAHKSKLFITFISIKTQPYLYINRSKLVNKKVVIYNLLHNFKGTEPKNNCSL